MATKKPTRESKERESRAFSKTEPKKESRAFEKSEARGALTAKASKPFKAKK